MTFRTPLYSVAAFSVVFAVAGALIPSTAVAGKHPVPSDYPLPDAWYLDFKVNAKGVPKRIIVDVPGQKVPMAYWYLTYTVTNNTGKEVDFLPEFEMVTQDGKILRSDRGVLRPVFDAIKKAEKNDLLVPLAQVIGTLHQGEDQAKDGVAIWPEPMARMGDFKIYIGGLNSEFIGATDDQGKPILDADGAPITLRKTLELNYVIWGDEIKPEKDEVQKKPQRWVMR